MVLSQVPWFVNTVRCMDVFPATYILLTWQHSAFIEWILKSLSNFISLLIYCVYFYIHTGCGALVEVRDQLVGSWFSPSITWTPRDWMWPWQHVPWPSEASHGPLLHEWLFHFTDKDEGSEEMQLLQMQELHGKFPVYPGPILRSEMRSWGLWGDA